MIVTAIYAIQQTEIGISCWFFLLLTSPMSAIKKDSRKFTAAIHAIEFYVSLNQIWAVKIYRPVATSSHLSAIGSKTADVKGLFWYGSGTYMNGLNVKPCAHLSQVFVLLLANKVILSTIRHAALGNQQINRLHKGVGLFLLCNYECRYPKWYWHLSTSQ